MVMQKVGRDIHDNNDGLPNHWEALEEDCCPRCLEPLAYFDHIEMWKCVCGFRISGFAMKDICYKIKHGDLSFRNSFGLNDFQHEPPF